MRAAAIAALAVTIAGCGGDAAQETEPVRPGERIQLASPAFRDGQALPRRFTCDGKGVSPPLRWTGVPTQAGDLVLVVEDQDVPGGGFTHWTVAKLPFAPDGSGRILEDNVAAEMLEGRNDEGSIGWLPACPPEGSAPHRYVFTLYALERVAELSAGASPIQVRAAAAASAMAEGRLYATYAR